MQHPLQINNHNLLLSSEEEEKIRIKAAKLERFCDHITSCHVTVDAPHMHSNKGVLYELHINIDVPGEELVVKHEPNENLHVAIRDAFDAAERQLKAYVQRRSGAARLHNS
ncbi:MAG: hypothetical protein AUJ57_11330 [Zetaproteobacteria bacterium CG1_02_53_45]|nr:MAG: hypothetical protein AUJ57_11330 [Zetaproteobacteria bacterium CG1_02_53_45]